MTPTDAKIVAHKKGWTIGKPHIQNRRDCCPWCMSKASKADNHNSGRRSNMTTEEEQFVAARNCEIQMQLLSSIPVGITTVEGLYQYKLAEQPGNSVLKVIVYRHYGYDGQIEGFSVPVTLEEFREAINDESIEWMRPRLT